jgi:hypothetical protein
LFNAYVLYSFFKEEREKILSVVLADDPEKLKEANPEGDDHLDEEAIGRLKKEGGKISFEQMGKLIGHRWKQIDPDRLQKYSALAAEDTERYKNEMQTYNGMQEAKMRSEALKPIAPPFKLPQSAAYDVGAASAAFGHPSGPSAYAGYGVHPGVDYSQYQMGMYGGYGYPGMGSADPSAQAGVAPQSAAAGQQFANALYAGMLGANAGGYQSGYP